MKRRLLGGFMILVLRLEEGDRGCSNQKLENAKKIFSLDLIIHGAEDEGHDNSINGLVSNSRLPKILSYTLQFDSKLVPGL